MCFVGYTHGWGNGLLAPPKTFTRWGWNKMFFAAKTALTHQGMDSY